jgi:RecB family endonuclease NucS
MEELALRIDLETGGAERLAEVTLESVGLRERGDLQRWITEHPELVGDDLLLITSEFDQWEIGARRVEDRLDVLFLTADGAPLVAELKRDRAADTTELQALKYAAFCSQLTVEDVVDIYGRHHTLDGDEAKEQVLRHAPALESGELGPVSIRLVAGSFGPSVTSVVLWLRDHDLDIGCVEITARADGNNGALITRRQIIPLPQAEDYLV